jgi:hypothetical protein
MIFLSAMLPPARARRATLAERQRDENRKSVLHGVTQILAESASLSEATPRIVQRVCNHLAWQLGAIWQINRDAQTLNCAGVWQIGATTMPDFERISRAHVFEKGVGLPGRVWASGQPAWVLDIAQDRIAGIERRKYSVDGNDIFDARRADEQIDSRWFTAGDAGEVKATLAKLRSALESCGFMYLQNHGVPQGVVDEVFAQSRRFFALPIEAKQAAKPKDTSARPLPGSSSPSCCFRTPYARCMWKAAACSCAVAFIAL